MDGCQLHNGQRCRRDSGLGAAQVARGAVEGGTEPQRMAADSTAGSAVGDGAGALWLRGSRRKCLVAGLQRDGRREPTRILSLTEDRPSHRSGEIISLALSARASPSLGWASESRSAREPLIWVRERAEERAHDQYAGNA